MFTRSQKRALELESLPQARVAPIKRPKEVTEEVDINANWDRTICLKPTQRKFFIKYEYNLCENSQKYTYRAQMYFQSQLNQTWLFEDIDSSIFEVFHGTYRICHNFPDKIRTAILLRLEKLPNEDGSFMIFLLEDLILFYSKLFKEQLARKEENLASFNQYNTVSLDFVKNGSTPITFPKLLDILLALTVSFKVMLAQGNLTLLLANAEYILKFVSDFITCFTYYDKTVRMNILSLQRRRRSVRLITSPV